LKTRFIACITPEGRDAHNRQTAIDRPHRM
jgi:hypothetical protein